MYWLTAIDRRIALFSLGSMGDDTSRSSATSKGRGHRGDKLIIFVFILRTSPCQTTQGGSRRFLMVRRICKASEGAGSAG